MLEITRRHFLSKVSTGIGGAAFASMLPKNLFGASSPQGENLLANHAPKAKRVIYLFMAGGPAQQDLFDYKPKLNEFNGQALPEHIRGGQRLTGMSGKQAILPLAGSQFEFAQHGKSGAWVSSLLPHTAKIVHDLCFVKSLWTEAINHDPAMTFFQTGSQIAGRPSLGSWVTYGLGSSNENLPGFIVLATKKPTDQPLYARLWGTGFLDSRYQGVRFSSGSDAVFYLSNPDGICQSGRRALLDKLSALNQLDFQNELDPEIETRIAQYEMAYRMQTSVPEVTDVSGETKTTKELYGSDSEIPGTFAANCLLARRMAECGVRFIQLYHPGWDQHNNLPAAIRKQAKETDQGCVALITDLKQRGMLEDTLVIWGGEFGRTAYSQGKLTKDNYGRDHHPPHPHLPRSPFPPHRCARPHRARPPCMIPSPEEARGINWACGGPGFRQRVSIMSNFFLTPCSAAILACTAVLPTAFAQEDAKPAPAAAAAADGFVPLFDGKTLTGWTNPYSFGKAEVVNGEIHLTADKKFFLCTEKPYANFVFEGDVHLPEGKANSGFIFRGIIKEDAKKEKSVIGYQAEVDGDDERGWSGGLYDEGLRTWFISPKKDDPASVAAFKERSAGAFKRNDWNTYRITCQGNKIKIEVNGVTTTDISDDRTASGPIAIQHHGEKGATYRFRNLRIKELK